MELIKETQLKLESARPIRGALLPHHASSITPNRKCFRSKTPSGRYFLLSSRKKTFFCPRAVQPIGDCSSSTNGEVSILWNASSSNGLFGYHSSADSQKQVPVPGFLDLPMV